MEDVPQGVKTAAGWAWRLLVLAAAVAGIGWLLAEFSAVSVPLAIALLLTALLDPAVRWLGTRGLRPAVASLLALAGLVILIAGIFVAIGAQVAGEAPSLADQTVAGVSTLLNWLANGPLHIDSAQIQGWIDQLSAWVATSRSEIATYLAQAGAQVGHFLAGTAIALLATFFFGYDGTRIWEGAVRLLPAGYRQPTLRAGERGWASLVAFMRATVVVALVDALGVLAAALILGVPLPWALFALTWIASFVPIVGAFTAGFVAVVLALVTHGWVTALIMLGAVVLVMELESHFLQPLLLSRAAKIHPLAVLIGIVIGSSIGGIVGALMAIPTLAFGTAFVASVRGVPVAPVEPTPPAKPKTGKQNFRK